jgi:hypothetical protein
MVARNLAHQRGQAPLLGRLLLIPFAILVQVVCLLVDPRRVLADFRKGWREGVEDRDSKG